MQLVIHRHDPPFAASIRRLYIIDFDIVGFVEDFEFSVVLIDNDVAARFCPSSHVSVISTCSLRASVELERGTDWDTKPANSHEPPDCAWHFESFRNQHRRDLVRTQRLFQK